MQSYVYFNPYKVSCKIAKKSLLKMGLKQADSLKYICLPASLLLPQSQSLSYCCSVGHQRPAPLWAGDARCRWALPGVGLLLPMCALRESVSSVHPQQWEVQPLPSPAGYSPQAGCWQELPGAG